MSNQQCKKHPNVFGWCPVCDPNPEPAKIKIQDSCWKCKQTVEAEIRGEDDCRYFFFNCQNCKTKWSKNAPSVRKEAK